MARAVVEVEAGVEVAKAEAVAGWAAGAAERVGRVVMEGREEGEVVKGGGQSTAYCLCRR